MRKERGEDHRGTDPPVVGPAAHIDELELTAFIIGRVAELDRKAELAVTGAAQAEIGMPLEVAIYAVLGELKWLYQPDEIEAVAAVDGREQGGKRYLVDRKSLALLEGSEIDFDDGLSEQQRRDLVAGNRRELASVLF